MSQHYTFQYLEFELLITSKYCCAVCAHNCTCFFNSLVVCEFYGSFFACLPARYYYVERRASWNRKLSAHMGPVASYFVILSVYTRNDKHTWARTDTVMLAKSIILFIIYFSRAFELMQAAACDLSRLKGTQSQALSIWSKNTLAISADRSKIPFPKLYNFIQFKTPTGSEAIKFNAKIFLGVLPCILQINELRILR